MCRKRPDYQPVPKEKKDWICKFCSKQFPRNNSLRRHEREACLSRPDYKPKISKINQIKTENGSVKIENTMICQFCEKEFKTMFNLKRHERVHTNEKPFLCKHCGKSFRENKHMKLHENIHKGIQPFACNTCGKKFNEFRVLSDHQWTHTGEKLYSCKFCNKKFTRKTTRNNHEKIEHTGEKRYPCQNCDENFKNKYFLQQHLSSCNKDNN